MEIQHLLVEHENTMYAWEQNGNLIEGQARMERQRDQTKEDVEALEEVSLFPRARNNRAARSSSKCS